MVSHDAGGTRLGGEFKGFRLTRALVLHADVGQLAEVASLFAITIVDVADEH